MEIKKTKDDPIQEEFIFEDDKLVKNTVEKVAGQIVGNKSVFVIPGATQQQIERFAELLAKESQPHLVTNSDDIQVFQLVDGEMFEIVTKLEKVQE